ncbi:MAG: glycosyltransferase family 4 protein, partial [Deltaproteobacteria bacterium]|nr:glycosyltransferase family 4 protein [Deltaproteobacteria bacterium]
MKIAVNALFLVQGKGGGLERYLNGVLASLQRRDKENDYTIFTNRDSAGAFTLGGRFKEVCCPVSASSRPFKILWEQVFFPAVLKKGCFDVLFSPGNIGPFSHAMPQVVVIHDMIPFVRPEEFGIAERLALKVLFYLAARSSAKVLTVSGYSRNDIIKRFNLSVDRVEVIYPGVDDTFGELSDADEIISRHGIERRYILCVASSRPYKNIDGLIRAYRLAKERGGLNEMLVIAGHAGRAQQGLERLVDELGLKRDVLFTGFLKDEELKVFYRGAGFFVYPSFYEGFGFPILEAMASAVPVIASNTASIPEVAGPDGLL